MLRSVCVFGASSSTLEQSIYDSAYWFGRRLAEDNIALVFGAGDTGVMGACARGARAVAGSRITGVIPEHLNQPGVAFGDCDELIITEDLRERMEVMEGRSDAFVVFPGGFGTFYELFEVLTLNQLDQIKKPVVLVNIGNFYDSVIQAFETAYAQRCLQGECRSLYKIADSEYAAYQMILDWKSEED